MSEQDAPPRSEQFEAACAQWQAQVKEDARLTEEEEARLRAWMEAAGVPSGWYELFAAVYGFGHYQNQREEDDVIFFDPDEEARKDWLESAANEFAALVDRAFEPKEQGTQEREAG